MNEITYVTHYNTVANDLVGLLPLVNLVLAIITTVRCVKTGKRGVELVLWLLFIWLVPVIGPIVALFVVRHPKNIM